MPTYEYRCAACGRELEVQQRMSDPELVHCEACGADKLERLISWTSVRSDTWKAALKADNPKEAFKGISAVDRSRSKRFGAAESASTAAASDPAPSGDAASAPAANAPAASAALDAETVDDDDDPDHAE